MSQGPRGQQQPQEPSGAATPPFPLPGDAVDRETLQGWERWRQTRHNFVPAPKLRLASYRRLSERDRGLHDLRRMVTNANLPFQETPMSAAVGQIMGSRIHNNALKHKPTTQSEPRLAPLILADKQAPGHRSQLAESVAQACYQSRRPGGYGEHWFVLKETLDAYADQLAARIDAG